MHDGDPTGVIPKTPDFSAFSEFLVGTAGDPAEAMSWFGSDRRCAISVRGRSELDFEEARSDALSYALAMTSIVCGLNLARSVGLQLILRYRNNSLCARVPENILQSFVNPDNLTRVTSKKSS